MFPVLANDRDIGIRSAIPEEQLIIDIAQVCLGVCMHATGPASLQLQQLLQGVRRPASPRSLHFALHPHPCRPPRFRMTRPQHYSLQRTIPHLQSARGGTLMGMASHRAQSREARGLHQSPHGQRPVAPRAARRHRNAPPHARMAERGRVLDPARAPHAGVVGAARAQGGGAGVGVGTACGGAGVGVGSACCKMLCVTAGVDLCYDCAGGLMPGGC